MPVENSDLMLPNLLGLVKLAESSIISENLRAMLDLILHISTSGFSLIPSPHLSNYYSKFPIVQFHIFVL